MRWGAAARRESAPTFLPGERSLASAGAADGSRLVASRDALHLVAADPDRGRRIPWEVVERAEWEATTSTFRLSEVGEWDGERPVHVFVLGDDARSLLEVVRERVTASIVLQRHVPVSGGNVRVVARRAPHGDAPLTWIYEYDAGVDPTDPAVRAAAAEALTRAMGDVGAR